MAVRNLYSDIRTTQCDEDDLLPICMPVVVSLNKGRMCLLFPLTSLSNTLCCSLVYNMTGCFYNAAFSPAFLYEGVEYNMPCGVPTSRMLAMTDLMLVMNKTSSLCSIQGVALKSWQEACPNMTPRGDGDPVTEEIISELEGRDDITAYDGEMRTACNVPPNFIILVISKPSATQQSGIHIPTW